MKTSKVVLPRFEAHGIKGVKSLPWRKTFKTTAALLSWCERNDAIVHATRDLEEGEK